MLCKWVMHHLLDLNEMCMSHSSNGLINPTGPQIDATQHDPHVMAASNISMVKAAHSSLLPMQSIS